MFLPILISVVLQLLLWFLLNLFLKSTHKSAFTVSLFSLFFYSYGHFYNLLEESGAFRLWVLGETKVILSLYGVLLFILAAGCLKIIKNWDLLSRTANLISLLLVTLSLLNISFYILLSSPNRQPATGPPLSSASSFSSSLPDIYYLILDGYPRADVLQEIHQYDNSAFLNHLREMGFYVAENSHSNYPGTSLSLASSLNFQYLDDLVKTMGPESTNRWPLSERIKNNEVCRLLRKKGYKIVAFDSGYFPTELRNADHFLTSGWFLNEFHDALLDTTPGWVLLKNLGRYTMQRKRILYMLDHLTSVPRTAGPVFVFAHIMALHPPFVFGPNGEEVQPPRKSSIAFWKEFGSAEKAAYLQGYKNQLTFINRKMETSIQTMLAHSHRPPVIILQGDHGSSLLRKEEAPEGIFLKERFSILNAYYMPASAVSDLYPEISPVNTFRVILNHFFGANLQLLKDENFLSERDHPYRLENVTAKISR